MTSGFSLRRLGAIARKEGHQMTRDPATILIAFVLPLVLLGLFAYAVSLDLRRVPLAVVVESPSAAARDFAAAFAAGDAFAVTPMRDRRAGEGALVSGAVRGVVIVPHDFDRRRLTGAPLAQVLADGAQPNTASFVTAYATGVAQTWAAQQAVAGPPSQAGVQIAPRFWFNPALESRAALVPGAIAIVMTMIGTLLTALVVAREWERGTMEAIMATPARVTEFLAGKLAPYFLLGFAAASLCVAAATLIFGAPLRGGLIPLALVTAVFLFAALGQGLLISATTKNQFLASQIALFTGFLPAFLLSGFLFEISAMPAPIQALTYLTPARYYVAALRTSFLAGDVWSVFAPSMAAMAGLGAVLFALALRNTKKSLD